MKFTLVFALILASSCSFLEKRKEHYSYVKKGISIEEVKKQSGEPIYESFDGDVSILTYDYCDVPMWKEAVGGILTFTMYNWHCNQSQTTTKLIFKEGSLISKIDNANADEKIERNRAMAASMQQIGNSINQQNQLNQQQQIRNQGVRCQSRTYGGTTFTDCN